MGKGKAQKTAAYAKASAVAIAPRVGARDKMAGQDGAPRRTEGRRRETALSSLDFFFVMIYKDISLYLFWGGGIKK